MIYFIFKIALNNKFNNNNYSSNYIFKNISLTQILILNINNKIPKKILNMYIIKYINLLLFVKYKKFLTIILAKNPNIIVI